MLMLNCSMSCFSCYFRDFACGQLTGPVAQLLMDLKLPITHLNLDVGMNTSDLIMANILRAYCNTLRYLTMYRGPFAIPFVMFPFDITFPELITLELAESITDDFNFVSFTPKLQKLSICESPSSEPPILPTAMIMNTEPVLKSPLPFHLRKFRLDYDCSLGDVRKLVRWFPLIKTLRMYLRNESFRLICGEWKDLEELEILGDNVTDEGITGLSFTSMDSQLVVTKNTLSIRSLKCRWPDYLFKLLKQVHVQNNYDNDHFSAACLHHEELRNVYFNIWHISTSRISQHESLNAPGTLLETGTVMLIIISKKTTASDYVVTLNSVTLQVFEDLTLTIHLVLIFQITDDGWEHLHAMPNLAVLKPSDGAWESQCSSFAKGLL